MNWNNIKSVAKSNSLDMFFVQNSLHKPGGSWGKERNPLYLDKEECTARLKHVRDRSGIKIPESLYYSLCYCIISKSHLLIDTSPMEKQGALSFGASLQHIIPLLVGMKSLYFSCTKLTSPDEILSKLVQHASGVIQKEPISQGVLHPQNNLGSSGSRLDSSLISSSTHLVIDIPLEEFPLKSNSTGSTNSSGDSFGRKKKKEKKAPSSIKTLEIPPSYVDTEIDLIPVRTNSAIDPVASAKGPQISQTIIIDNLELAPIQTQLSLLEVMRSQKVLLHGFRYNTTELFTVIVITGNLDSGDRVNELTEHMYDSFLIRTVITKPFHVNIPYPISIDSPAYTAKELLSLRSAVSTIYVSKDIEQFMRNIVVSLRIHAFVASGVSPRASIALKQAARVVALFSGQKFVTPAHVLSIAPAVLSHRLKIKPGPHNSLELVLSVLDSELPPF